MLEWKKLGEVCKTVTPPKKLVTKDYHERGLYPVIDQGQSEIVGFTDDECSLLPDGEYVLFGDHTRFVKYHKGRFAQGADGLKILITKESITPRYFYYAFANTEVPTRGYSRHWSIAKELEIPVPSIAEQTRIVGILDTFIATIDNLKQQIASRRKQYEHYRNQLLDLEGKEGVEIKTIGEVCKTITPPKKLATKNYQLQGLFPIIDQGQSVIVGYTDDESALVPNGEYVLFGDHTRFVKFYKGRFAQGADGLKILKVKDFVSSRYFYFAFSNAEVPSRGYSRHWSIAKELPIPVPSITEQQRIVSILDTFEASIANLEQQLVQRERQYEYYRNKLLTFE